MEELRSYVVRVYRQQEDGVAGVVESVATGQLTPFRSPAELWAIVCRPSTVRRPKSFDEPREDEP